MKAEMNYIQPHGRTKCISCLRVSISSMHEGPSKHLAPFHLLQTSFKKTLGLLFISKQIDLLLKYASIKQAWVTSQLVSDHIKHLVWLKYKENSNEGNLSMQKGPCQLKSVKSKCCLRVEHQVPEELLSIILNLKLNIQHAYRMPLQTELNIS